MLHVQMQSEIQFNEELIDVDGHFSTEPRSLLIWAFPKCLAAKSCKRMFDVM